jgi:hypothetical protein
MAELDIRSLTCVKKEDRPGRDEVSLLIDGVKVFGPEKMGNGDEIAIPLGNQPIPGSVQVELFEVGGGSPVQLGAVVIPDFLPGNHDYFGIFGDELPGAFYFMKYQVAP